VIARSAVPDSQNILTIGMKLRIIFLLLLKGVKPIINFFKVTNLKEIPLLINLVSLIIVHYSYLSPLAAPDTCRKIIYFPI
jgi:hypothetical protein